MRGWTSYAGGRVFAVVTRPLTLFVANNYFAASAAQDLSVVFLASTLALVVTAADTHRVFYLRHFDAERGGRARFTFCVFVASIAMLTSFGAAVAFGITFHFTSVPTALAAGAFFVSEKLADELLRIRLFERNFAAWGNANIQRSALQLLTLSVLLFGVGRDVPVPTIASALVLVNLLVFVPRVPPVVWRMLAPRRHATLVRLARRAVRSVLGNWNLWALAIATALVGYIDRAFALVLDKSILPLFMLVVMCFSIVQMAVDFFYTNRVRRDFLERRIQVRAALTSRHFVASLAGGLVVGGVAAAAVLASSEGGERFPLFYVLVIAGVQVSVAITLVPQQILYWQQRTIRLFYIEIAFWTLLIASAGVGFLRGLPVSGMLGLLLACIVVRLAIYLALARGGASAPVPAP